MKKILPLILIIIGSMYTKKLVSIVKNYDDIMIKINNNKHKYYIKPIDPIIKDDTIIPGIKGSEVDVDRSYSRMKRYGKYEESFIVLKDIKVKPIDKDKYIIGGNERKNMVTLIFNKKVDKKYCYLEEKIECNDKYKIIPNIILKDNYYINLKKYLKSGSIISIYTSEKLKEELPVMISYIKSKGYKIVDLDTLLE